MESQNITRFSGMALAVIAAGMAGSAGQAQAKTQAGTVALVHCAGLNVCKGHNDCKTADNACKGQASCKGQSFSVATAEACGNLGGKVIDEGMSVAVSPKTFVHCMGANVCKGHNDCKTASNACKGQGSCKGQGFIALPASTCSNIGGTAG
jgi:hypothetical protein